jgi:hypothetical protein
MGVEMVESEAGAGVVEAVKKNGDCDCDCD